MLLRPFQKSACVNVMRELESNQRVVLVAPTGSGKTVMGTALIGAQRRRGKRCLFVAHRRELILQSAKKLAESLGQSEVGLVMPGQPLRAHLPVQVASIQTLLARGFPDDVGFLVSDECVSGDTVIGGKPARDIAIGDLVDSYDHALKSVERRRVSHVFDREFRGELVVIRAGHREIVCTKNHPIWVDGVGYAEAEDVEVGDVLHLLENIRVYGSKELRSNNMFSRMQKQKAFAHYVRNKSSIRLRENDQPQPDAPRGNPKQGLHYIERDGAWALDKRRKWQRANKGRVYCCGSSGVVATGIRKAGSALGRALSASIQARRRLCGLKDRSRGRWSVPLRVVQASAGQKEGRGIRSVGVESVTRVQSGSIGVDRVYNFEVEGTHTFFANGILTHNCHHYRSTDWSDVFKHYPNALCVGLTATPERQDGKPLGDVYQSMVVAAQYSELLRDGYLVPCRVYQPDSGLKSNEVAQDPVTAYQKLANGTRCFVFASRVDQANELCTKFNAQNISARTIDAHTSKSDRDNNIEQFRRGTVRILVNVGTLTEGTDIPEAGSIIIARRLMHCGLFLQVCGRVLRPAEGKTEAIIIDLTGATLLHGFPTEDREYSLDGEGMRRTSPMQLRVCPKCGATNEAWRNACPDCGFVPPKPIAPELKIYSQELREVFAGVATAQDAKRRELDRLLGVAEERGWSGYAVQKQYAKLFGEMPTLEIASVEFKNEQLERLRMVGIDKGYKAGWAGMQYKRMFGEWPGR